MPVANIIDSAGKLNISLNNAPTGNTIRNIAAETAFAEPQITLPPEIWYKSRALDTRLGGLFGTGIVVPSFRGRFYLGNTLVADTGSITTAANILAPKQWWGNLDIVVLEPGANGLIECQGVIMMQLLNTIITLPTTNTASIPINLTTPLLLKMTAQWSLQATDTYITLRRFTLKG